MSSASPVKAEAPAVSILMPVFNAAKTLRECIDSILAQSMQAFELIAVDDFSTDDSAAILGSYEDPRIRVIESTEKGIVAALNTGLRESRSEYVARMDADDVMYPQRLEKQLAAMIADPSITLCAAQARKFPEDIIKAGYAEYMRWQNACLSRQDIANQIYIESPFAHPSVMFRKSRIEALGGYINGEFPEDYELWLRLFHAGETMMKLDQVLIDWRESEGRLSRTCKRYAGIAFDRLRAEYLAKDERLKHRPVVFWGAGRKTRRRAAHLIEQGVEPSAWIDINPNKIGNSYHDAETYLPEWLVEQDNKPFVLNYVRNHGARDYCRAFLEEAGYIMGVDFLDVA